MFSSDDTIVAIATPPGKGGIGVVRVSGPDAVSLLATVISRRDALTPRYATLTKVRLDDGPSAQPGDEVIVTWFPAPRSYTGEHVVEISAHGSPVVLRGVVNRVIAAGARLARPGEFTLRAFLNGRLDLVQAEAVGDLIEAATPLQARVAYDQLEGTLSDRLQEIRSDLLDLTARLEASLDFPDEGFRFIEPSSIVERLDRMIGRITTVLSESAKGRIIRDGATVVIVGRTNVGKSSLFNALLGQDRAIVTPIAGTTRDLVTEQVDLGGVSITLVDTAGLRDATDAVEVMGVERARRAGEAADLQLVTLDSGEALTPADEDLLASSPATKRIVVASKADLPPRWVRDEAVRVSTRARTGLDELRRAIIRALSGAESLTDGAAISNLRHVTLLKETHTILERVRAAVTDDRAPEEMILVDLNRARIGLGAVTGAGASDEVLDEIFKRFCVGK